MIRIISLYIALLIPFGLWNKFNHGVFKVTQIEGGAGVSQTGFWQLKLPDGYIGNFDWQFYTLYDFTKPKLYTYTEQQQNIKLFEKELFVLSRNLKKHESKEDSSWIDYMIKIYPDVFPVHNTKYSLEREKAIWEITIQNITNDPVYYFKSRIYHFMRFYVTGINYKTLEESNSFLSKVKAIYPFVITFVFIFLGLIFMALGTIFKKIHFKNIFIFVLLFLYFGAVHTPFAIQARYTIPVHLLIIAILSVAILKTIKFRDEKIIDTTE